MLKLLPSMKSQGADTRAINPEMLSLARRSRGMRRGELAAASGIAQARIRLMERGTVKPTADELHALAEATHYPAAFFMNPATFIGQPKPHVCVMRDPFEQMEADLSK